jgi:hypothetical protein
MFLCGYVVKILFHILHFIHNPHRFHAYCSKYLQQIVKLIADGGFLACAAELNQLIEAVVVLGDDGFGYGAGLSVQSLFSKNRILFGLGAIDSRLNFCRDPIYRLHEFKCCHDPIVIGCMDKEIFFFASWG